MEKFKYYADSYLELRDIFNKMTMNEAIGYQIVSQIQLLPIYEIPYLTGEKEDFKKRVGFFIGINRVLMNDTTGKYKKILEARKVLQYTMSPNQSYSHFS